MSTLTAIRSAHLRRSPIRRIGARGASLLPLKALFRAVILERDRYRCRRCGAGKRPGRGGGLQAAHIYPQGSHPALRFEVDNAVTLCASCHIYGPLAWHRHPQAAIIWASTALGLELLQKLDALASYRASRTGHRPLDKELTRIYLEGELRAYKELAACS